jgi:hypothetical protein
VTAEPAVAIDAAHPGDACARADGDVRREAFDDFADNLVAGKEVRLDRGQVAFDNVEIGAADAASEDLEENVVGTGRRSPAAVICQP